MVESSEKNWVEEIGKPAYGSIAEMVAALECDYDRLDELRDERDSWEADEDATEAAPGEPATWASENPDDAEELKELEEAACPCGNECSSREDAETMIHEDALSVEVRSGWYSPGDRDADTKPEDFLILLSTGGPAVRIRGELDGHGEPCRAWLEVQDWFKPWTQYFDAGQATLLTYCRCFFFGE